MKTVKLEKNKLILDFPFDVHDIEVIRGITGREYYAPNRVWRLPATQWHLDEVRTKLIPLGFEIDSKVEAISNQKMRVNKKPPEGLFPFQFEGLKFILSTGGRCIIADDMGLGKTIEALAFIHVANGKTLIVSPSNVLYKWRRECEKWLPTKKVQIVSTGKDTVDADADIHIMSYGIMVSKYESIPYDYDNIIFDEAHYLKSHKSQRTRIAKAVVRKGIDRVLFLSGTPFMNHPSELFPMLNMLDPVGYDNYYSYAIRYCGAQRHDGGWFFPPNGVSNLSELSARLSSIMIRRTKGEVLTELPDLTRTVVPVDLENRAAYRAAVKDIQMWLKGKNKSVMNPAHTLTRLNVLRQIVGEGKTNAAIELAENVLQSDKKVVLFCHHKDVVSNIHKALQKYGVGEITGDVSAKERDRYINLFLDPDSEIRVMIITVAGAEGIDLFSASDIIFVEREWTPAREEQAESRLHRQGQKNAVSAYYLVANNTVDEKLNNIVARKRNIIGQVVTQDEIITEILKDLTGKESDD